MMEAKCFLGSPFQSRPVCPGGFQQGEGAFHVGTHEIAGAVNGTIHMAFGRKVHDGPGLVLGQQTIHQGPVTDVAVHKNVARIILDGSQAFQIPGVGQGIQIDHRLIIAAQPVQNKITADKTSTTRYKNHLKPYQSTRANP